MTMQADPRHLRNLIRDAVRDAIDPAVRTGVLLSGGVDSSTVAAFAAHLPAFTGWYEGDAYDERPWARIAAGSMREHHEIQITPDDFVEHFDDFVHETGATTEGPGAFGQYMVASYVSGQGMERILSGEGGDELFGGYARVMRVAGRELPVGYEDFVLPDDYPRDLEAALEREWEHLFALLELDERINAAFNLVAIAPMTDQRVVEYVLQQPAIERVGKDMLRAAVREDVPFAILARRDKRGFPVPFVEWAQRNPVKTFVAERIGYVPDASQPWSREWWNDMCEAVAVGA